MFESLSDKLQDTLKRLRGEAKLTESNIADAMQDIRLAMLDADVNIQVVKDFIDEVRAECIGVDVLRTVTPGQQVIKIVNDKLVELMGEAEVPLKLDSKPSVIMMVGLHGSGKTTTAAKLALHLKKNKKKVMLAAGDIYRPAAIDQLEVLGKEIGVPVYAERGNVNVASIARNAIESAKLDHIDVIIIDTAGRLQIDESMVQELVQISQASRADEILLVADAALGQEAVSVADHFHKALGLTGLILTKLDGDARGGAALSVRAVSGAPIKFVGMGEALEALEPFYPDRLAGRILGMGDVLSLVEKAEKAVSERDAEAMAKKMMSAKFDFDDFLQQYRMVTGMGGIGSMMKMLPGIGSITGESLLGGGGWGRRGGGGGGVRGCGGEGRVQKEREKKGNASRKTQVEKKKNSPSPPPLFLLSLSSFSTQHKHTKQNKTKQQNKTDKQAAAAEKQFRVYESMIQSMTREERTNPDLLAKTPSRRRRVARGSGRTETDVAGLVATFASMRSRMRSLSRMLAAGGAGGAAGMPSMTDEELLEATVATASARVSPGKARRRRPREGRGALAELAGVGAASRGGGGGKAKSKGGFGGR